LFQKYLISNTYFTPLYLYNRRRESKHDYTPPVWSWLGYGKLISAILRAQNFLGSIFQLPKLPSELQYSGPFQRFCLALDLYFTFSIFAILPLKSAFPPYPSPIHANTRGEGTHVLKPYIYLGSEDRHFSTPHFLENENRSSDRHSKLNKRDQF